MGHSIVSVSGHRTLPPRFISRALHANIFIFVIVLVMVTTSDAVRILCRLTLLAAYTLL